MINFLPIKPYPKPWTADELNAVRRLSHLPDFHIAKVVDRSPEAIKKKRQEMGIIKTRGRKSTNGDFSILVRTLLTEDKKTAAFIKDKGCDFSGAPV